ncbi:MAG: polysaccharide biosynthesis C-terminal domain-containing protein, partial [Bacteroidota bacterium]
LPVVGFLIFGLLYVLLQPQMSDYFSANSELFVHFYYWVIPLALFVTYLAISENYASLLLRIVVPKIIREVIIRVLTVVLFVMFYFGFMSMNMFIGLFISIYGIALLLNLFYIYKISPIYLKPDFSFITPALKSQMIRYSLFIIIASIGTSIVAKIDTFMVSAAIGLKATAIYSVAYFMAIIIEIPSRSISTITYPIVSEAINNSDWGEVNDMYKRVCLNQLLVGCFIFIVLWVGVDDIFRIIPNGNTYVAGKYVILFIGLSKLFDAATGFNASILILSRYYYYMLFFIFLLSGLTIATNLWLIPLYGINGTAIATAISIFLYNAILTFFIWWRLKSQPFSLNMLKIVAVFLLTLGLNYFLFHISNPILDGIVRVIIALLVYGSAAYFLKISPEMNALLKASLKKGAFAKLNIFNKKG